jgi:hypothetical protein
MSRAVVDEWVDRTGEELMLFTGFDDAIVGVGQQFSNPPLVIYSHTKMIEMILEDGGTYEEAIEHFSFNIIGAWMGEQTPIVYFDAET